MKVAAVADEWALVRHGAEAQLRKAGLRVSVSAGTFHELDTELQRPQRRDTHIAVVGSLADIPQVTAVRELAEQGLPVIALNEHRSPAVLLDLLSAGALAVVSRTARESDLGDAVRAVADGNRYMGPSMLASVFDRATRPAPTQIDLTRRERDVLRELAAGATNEEIGDRLHIGTQTVKTHLTNIYDKLGVRRRTHAVRLALTLDLL